MKPVTVVTGRAVPLDRTDVDTDQIIPSDWLKRVERTGFGAGLFSEWRDDRDFVLNHPEYVGATILVAGHNFGTGSSREHAVWALMDYGFEAVVSSRFADIFRNNCTKQGLLPVQVTPEFDHALLAAVEADPTLEITIDVARTSIEAPAAGLSATFPLDDFTRERLLNGWDDIGLSLRHADEISRLRGPASGLHALGVERARPALRELAGEPLAVNQAECGRGALFEGPVPVGHRRGVRLREEIPRLLDVSRVSSIGQHASPTRDLSERRSTSRQHDRSTAADCVK